RGRRRPGPRERSPDRHGTHRWCAWRPLRSTRPLFLRWECGGGKGRGLSARTWLDALGRVPRPQHPFGCWHGRGVVGEAAAMGLKPAHREQPPGAARPLGELVAVAVVYYVAARVSLRIALVGESITPLWPPTG